MGALSLRWAIAAALLLLCLLAERTRAAVLWREGESAAGAAVRPAPPGDLVGRLSGGNWLAFGDDLEGRSTAQWSLVVEESGRYRVWLRKAWRRGRFRWRIAGSRWRLAGHIPAENVDFGKKRGFALAWYYLGSVELDAGLHELELERLDPPGRRRFAAVDAFYLTTDDLRVPAGASPPETVRSERREDSWFPVAFYEDPLEPTAATDVSRLVPAPAGQRGRVRVKEDQLVVSSEEEPIRFWGATARVIDVDPEVATHRARYLRKHGINAVRHHPLEQVLGLLDEEGRFDPEALARFDWWFAELKRNGIYSIWCPFFPHHIRPSEGYPRFAELPGKAYWTQERGVRSVGALSLLEPELQDSEWRWLRTLLEHRNPHTGLRYVDDPALAIVQIRNEASLFWHDPLNALAAGEMPEHARRLRRRWAAWVHERYTDDAALAAAWKRDRRQDDLWGSEELAVPAAHELRGVEGGQLRHGDFLRFLGEIQRGAYRRRSERLRALGYDGIITTSAWKAASRTASAANLWTDAVGDMVVRHEYSGGSLEGKRSSHRILEGPYRPVRPLAHPGGGLLRAGREQLSGRPFGLMEWTTRPPSPWKFVSAPLIAFYGVGLQGWDAALHFDNTADRMRNGWPESSSYVTDTPHYMGQYPALALAVHRGDLAAGPDLELPVLGAPTLFGARAGLALTWKLPTWLLAKGRVAWRLAPERTGPPAALPEEPSAPVAAPGAQLHWDAARPLVRIDTPRTRGVLGTGAARLSGLRLDVATPGVSLLVSSLDDQPLESATRILVTALARDRAHGARYDEERGELTRSGGGVLWLEPVRAAITLPGTRPTRVFVLDPYGRRTGAEVAIEEDGAFRIDGRYATYLYEVVRSAPQRTGAALQ